MSPRQVPEEPALPEDDLMPGMSLLPRASWLSPIKRLLFIVTMLPVGVIFDWAIMERPGQGLRWALRENRRWTAPMSGQRPLPATPKAPWRASRNWLNCATRRPAGRRQNAGRPSGAAHLQPLV